MVNIKKIIRKEIVIETRKQIQIERQKPNPKPSFYENWEAHQKGQISLLLKNKLGLNSENFDNRRKSYMNALKTINEVHIEEVFPQFPKDRTSIYHLLDKRLKAYGVDNDIRDSIQKMILGLENKSRRIKKSKSQYEIMREKEFAKVFKIQMTYRPL